MTFAPALVKNKYILSRVAFIFLALLILCSIYLHSFHSFRYSTDQLDVTDAYPLTNDEKLTQSFYATGNELSEVHIMFGTYGRVNSGELIVTLLDSSGALLYSWNINTNQIVDNTYQQFELPGYVRLSPGDVYSLEIVEKYKGNNGIAVWTSEGGNLLNSDGIVNTDRTICYELVYDDTEFRNKVLPFILIACILIIVFAFIKIDKLDFSFLRWLLITLIILVIIEVTSVDLFQKISREAVLSQRVDSVSTQEIKPDQTFEYSFTNEIAAFTDFVIFADGKHIKNASIRIVNKDTGEIYMDGQPAEDEYITDKETGLKAIKIRGARINLKNGLFPEGNYAVYVSNIGKKGRFRIGVTEDENGSKVLNYRLIRSTRIGYIVAFLILFVLAFYLICVSIYARRTEFSIAQFFLWSAIPFVGIFTILYAPWCTPDSDTHFLAVYRLSNILLGHGGREAWMARSDDVDFFKNFLSLTNPSIREFYTILYNVRVHVQSSALIDLPVREVKMEYYSIFCYLPLVIGMCIGRLLRLGAVLTVYLARLSMGLFYIGTCYHAIKKAPVGKFVFAAVSLLPISLMMSSAFSYDGMVLVSTIAFTAALLRLKKQYNWKNLTECGIWSFVIGATKGGGYLVFLLLAFTLVNRDWKKTYKRVIFVVLPGVLSIILFDVIIPWGSQLFQFGSEGTGYMAASFALEHPVRYLNLVFATYLKSLDSIVFSMGGVYLGWFEWTMPGSIALLFIIIAGVYSVYEKDDMQLNETDMRLFIFVIFLEVLFMPVMLLSWTPIGSSTILGLQGRYYLPMLSLVILVLTKIKMRRPIRLHSTSINEIIRPTVFKWYAFLYCTAVYYMLRLYLER